VTYQTPLQKAAGFSGLSKVEQERRARVVMTMATMLLAVARTLPPKMITKAHDA